MVQSGKACRICGRMTLGLRISTLFRGRFIGKDQVGNRYYETRRARARVRSRRWVLYAGAPEASAVPPEWHAWLHHTTATPIPLSERKPWQQPHQPNLTGTAGSYRPPGHDYRGGHRPPATGDYESWTPGS